MIVPISPVLLSSAAALLAYSVIWNESVWSFVMCQPRTVPLLWGGTIMCVYWGRPVFGSLAWLKAKTLRPSIVSVTAASSEELLMSRMAWISSRLIGTNTSLSSSCGPRGWYLSWDLDQDLDGVRTAWPRRDAGAVDLGMGIIDCLDELLLSGLFIGVGRELNRRAQDRADGRDVEDLALDLVDLVPRPVDESHLHHQG